MCEHGGTPCEGLGYARIIGIATKAKGDRTRVQAMSETRELIIMICFPLGSQRQAGQDIQDRRIGQLDKVGCASGDDSGRCEMRNNEHGVNPFGAGVPVRRFAEYR